MRAVASGGRFLASRPKKPHWGFFPRSFIASRRTAVRLWLRARSAAASASPRFRPRAPCRSLLFAAPSARKVRVAFLLALRSAAPLLARSLASAPCARSGSLPPCYRVGARSPSTHRAASPQRFPPACRLAAPAPRRGALGVAPCGVSASGGRVPRPPPLIKPLLSSRGGG